MIKLISKTFYDEKKTTDKLIDFLRTAKKVSMGEKCSSFEESLALWQGRKHCVLVNSGSSANLALLQSLLNLGRLKKGDRVGFSALTWATNVMPIIQLGLTPVPLDIDINTLNVSSINVSKVKLKCLFITNLLGLCHDLGNIKQYCKDNDIILLEDNCESMGSETDGKKLGNFGLASTFSFYVGHHLSTIEGGAVMTDDKELDDMLKMVRAHGWRRDTGDELDFYGRYTFYDLGYNLRPTEITGVLGLEGMKTINEVVEKREVHSLILSEIYTSNRVHSLYSDHMDVYSSFCTPIVCVTDEDKEIILKRCDKIGIESRPIVGGNITQQPFFKKYVGEYDCPMAELAHKNGLYVANNPNLQEWEIEAIKEALWLM